MLYWICPECGHECSPAIRECPTCTAPETVATTATPPPAMLPAVLRAAEQPTPRQAAASQELLSLAQSFQPAPVAPLPPSEPQRQQPVSANGRDGSAAALAVAIDDETVEIPAPEPKPSKTLITLGKPAMRAARPAQLATAKLSAVPVPLGIGSPAMSPSPAPSPAQFGLKPAQAAPAGDIDFQVADFADPRTAPLPSEPLPSRRRSVAFMRAQLPGADCGGMAIGELEPLAPLVPRSDIERTNGASTPLACKLRVPVVAPSLPASGLKPAGESLAELLNALENSAEEIDRAAIQAIHTSFTEQPEVALLGAPAEVVTAPAPPGQQCLRSEKPRFTPAEPDNRGRAAVIAGPQTPTLAGPSLPQQLVNFNHQSSSLRRRRSRWASWPVSLLVITIIILGLVSALQYLSQDRDTRAASVAAPVQAPKPPAAPRLPVVVEHPAARSVEVAGIRILNGPNKKAQLQFIVINHSASELTGLNIHIAVRSVDTPADTPLFTVSTPVAALAPNQSKEIRMDLNSSIQPSEIPDWQSLRTEVLVGRQ
jgi:hypothetical protein